MFGAEALANTVDTGEDFLADNGSIVFFRWVEGFDVPPEKRDQSCGQIYWCIAYSGL